MLPPVLHQMAGAARRLDLHPAQPSTCWQAVERSQFFENGSAARADVLGARLGARKAGGIDNQYAASLLREQHSRGAAGWSRADDDYVVDHSLTLISARIHVRVSVISGAADAL